ncbi:hypothetical protein CRENPOLYSF2_1430010 [Crenothrix polyspora]|uniref:Uncharacterized protein n=1 Tax=Crenothrix polyspora TaxID=360316 RepID=A0A1R4H1C9_9GAMM|nr:hypothetical protein [Crenothrix polyspora]SJM90038.1 hypothetical protein CRENPOLYSF2_1430010 [Crenothrix polyspora]
MSGYLQRLAERSLKTAPEIHSTARLPYSGIALAEHHEDLLGNGPVAFPEVAAISKTSKYAQINPETPLHEASKSPVEPESSHIIPESLGSSANTLIRPIPSLVSETENVSVKSNPGQQSKLEQTKQVPVNNESSLHGNAREIDREFSPLVSPVAQADIFAPLSTRPTIDKGSTGSIKPRPIVTKDQLGNGISFKESASESNEVHVTIGRIEITAVHAQTPSKPASTPVRKTLSLDEYLAKRDGVHS